MYEYSPVWPHGNLREIFAEVFFVTGTNKTQHAGVEIQTSRNMVVVRRGQALTLLNTVRLDDAGLHCLESLGRVRDIIRLGAFHGRDDPFYRDRYGATLWALPGSMHADGRSADCLLRPQRPLPIDDSELFVFESAKFPEAALLLRQDGGVLVTCDAVQNWTAVDPYFSPDCGARFMAEGLIRPMNIPSTWRQACAPDPADFRRLLELQFRHLISAHGEPSLGEAHAQLCARVTGAFGSAEHPGGPGVQTGARV